MGIIKYIYNRRLEFREIHTDLDLIEYFRMRGQFIDSRLNDYYSRSYRGGDLACFIVNLCVSYGANLTFGSDHWSAITAVGTMSLVHAQVDFTVSIGCDDLPVGVLEIYNHLKSIETRITEGDIPDGLIKRGDN